MAYDIVVPLNTAWSLNASLALDGEAMDLSNRSFYAEVHDNGSTLFLIDVLVRDASQGKITLFIPYHRAPFDTETTAAYQVTVSDEEEGFIVLLEGTVQFVVAVPGTAYPCTVQRGGTFYALFTVKQDNGQALNLMAFSGRCRIRASNNTLDVLYAPRVEIKNERGLVDIAMSVLETPQLTPGTYFYDVNVDNGVEALAVAQGPLTVI